MKKSLITSLLVSLLLSTGPISAEEIEVQVRTTTPAETRVEMKARVEERRASMTERRQEMQEERKAEREGRQASSTARRIEMQQGLAKRKVEHTAKVLTATVERLEMIIGRLESRIAKVKVEGGMTAESEVAIAVAKVHLSEAKTGIAAFSTIDLSAEKLSDNMSALRAAAGEVKTHLREAHTSLVNVLRALKPGQAKAGTTTTVETQ